MPETTQTIQTAKEYLDGELAKYKTWDEVANKEKPVFLNSLFCGIIDKKTGKEKNPKDFSLAYSFWSQKK